MRDRRIELLPNAWEALVLPLNQSRVFTFQPTGRPAIYTAKNIFLCPILQVCRKATRQIQPPLFAEPRRSSLGALAEEARIFSGL